MIVVGQILVLVLFNTYKYISIFIVIFSIHFMIHIECIEAILALLENWTIVAYGLIEKINLFLFLASRSPPHMSW